MDIKDEKIIGILKENSRQSVREISSKTKIRPSTVHQRIQKMLREGLIEKFTIKTNDRLLGEDFIVLMLVKGTTSDYIDSKTLHNKHVKEIFGVTGEYDLLIKLKFKNVGEFHEFVLNFRKNKADITSTLTMVVTANLKENI